MLCIAADGILATTFDGMRSDEVLATAVAMIRAERRIFCTDKVSQTHEASMSTQ